jgi:hypothetical protein
MDGSMIIISNAAIAVRFVDVTGLEPGGALNVYD